MKALLHRRDLDALIAEALGQRSEPGAAEAAYRIQSRSVPTIDDAAHKTP